MKLTKSILKEFIKDIIAEGDGHPQMTRNNGEVPHNWATHMEWKSSTDKQRYGDMIGEVVHHKLFEDGSIPSYDVKFGNRIVKNIPAEMLEVIKAQEHMHDATDEKEEDEDETEESNCG